MNEIFEKLEELSAEKKELFAEMLNEQGMSLLDLPIPSFWENSKNRFPLSFTQRRLWFIEQLEPNLPVYNCSVSIRLKGEIDFNSFERALNEIIDRHKILKANFIEIEGKPVQFICEDYKLAVSVVDLSNLDLKEQEDKLKELVQKDASYIFKLDHELLICGTLYRLSSYEHEFCLTMHHLISDGWSTSIMMKEFAKIYDNIVSNKQIELPELSIQYMDYSKWKNLICYDNTFTEQKKYWLNKLTGHNYGEIVTNKQRPAVLTHNGNRFSFEIEDKLLKDVRVFCQEYHVTQFMFLMALMQIMIFRYTCSNDISIGTTVANRTRKELEDLIGFFANTIVINQEMDGDSDFLMTMENTKRSVMEGFQYQACPFDIVINQLNIEKDLSRNPLFQVMFSYQSNMEWELESGGLKFDELKSVYNRTAMFDLKFEFIESEEKINCSIDYNVDLFYSDTIEKMAANFINILKDVINNPKVNLKNINMLDKEEKERIIHKFNNTNVDYPDNKTIHQLFEEQVQRTPDNIALVFNGENMTYKELNNKSNYVATSLIANGVGNGDNVAIMANRGFEMIIGMIAILKEGGAYVPIDPEYPHSRKEYIVKNSDVSLVLTCKECKHKKTIGNCKEVLIDLDHTDDHYFENLNINKDSKEFAYTIYTSGSAGTPKGVMIEHHSAVNLINWVNRTFNVNNKDKLLFVTSICFDLSVYDIFGILAAGGQIVIAGEDEIRNPEKLLNIIKNEKITFWNSVPSTMSFLLNAKFNDTSLQESIRLVFLSGDWIPTKLPDNIRVSFPNAQIISLGGATEGTVWSIYYLINEVNKNWSSIPYGKPIDNNYFYILDKYRNPVPYGSVGELYIGGVGVARGYSNDLAKTEASFFLDSFNPNDGSMMYKTGDIGRYMPDGNIEFLGRKDNQVKIRGFRIEIGEIENQLLKFDFIKETVVVLKEYKDNKYLCAYIVTDYEVEDNRIKEQLLKELPAYMIPAFFIRIDSMPLTRNGKVDIKSLSEPKRNGFNTGDSDKIINDVEKRLQKIWKEVLDVDDVYLFDNFFDLGGNSLNSVMLLAKVQKEFEVNISLVSFFQNPTIKGIENLLNSADDEYSASNLKTAKEKELYPLSIAQQGIYLAQALEPDSIRYNIPVVFKITGEPDISKMENIINKIIQRHESLRTIITNYNGEAVQKIIKKVDFKINYIEKEWDADIDDVLIQAIKPFNMEGVPLLRATLFKAGFHEYYILFDIHHIIFDGISVEILIKEFNLIHNGIECENLRFQYKDYSEWQKEFIKSQEEKNQEEFWISELSSKISDLRLPVTKNDVYVKRNFDGEYYDMHLDASIMEQISKTAKENEITLHMFFLAVLYLLLNKVSGNEDILISIPLSGRRRADFEKIIGVFINTMPLRCKISKNMLFTEFLKEVKNISSRAYENQESPLNLVLPKLSEQSQETLRHLLDNVIFEFRENEIQDNDLQMDGLKFHRYNLKVNTTHFLLDWMGINNGRDVLFRILYRKEYFENTMVQYLAELYVELIKKIIENPKIRIKDIDISCNSEKRSIGFEDELKFDF
ncbi:non-ribosomal peptide synthetase [Clostridium frigidicarnis]|uniref:Amino acid adenylation domain-containing protein n=1 Tax=Clostridium frigidicarnis TaxID=84698 RepID=A0A1I1B6M7_9CLOT|nr:non-ribosomal peptide synthetase [Clostridium frigidicarnis]SFB45422.1 amino acid adenylation domain-containing protein [Clostridium frigidicarnis]